jgi:hypothetical protein
MIRFKIIARNIHRQILYNAQKKSGLCVKCDNSSLPGHVFCDFHLKQHNEQARISKTKFRETHICTGLCVECFNPIAPHKRKCEACLTKQRERSLKIRNKRREEGKCVRCGCPLHVDMDAGYVNCLNCRENIGSVF